MCTIDIIYKRLIYGKTTVNNSNVKTKQEHHCMSRVTKKWRCVSGRPTLETNDQIRLAVVNSTTTRMFIIFVSYTSGSGLKVSQSFSEPGHHCVLSP